jgi:predicted PurR-regulated permease PerM
MKKFNENLKTLIIIILNILLFLIIIYNLFYKQKEGFSVNDIDNMFGNIKDITQVVGDIPKEINNIDNKLTSKINDMGKEIEKKTINILTDKLKSIFTQIADMFNNAIIKPLLSLFKGIGNIFVQIFNILKEISNKIVSLPNCIFTYAIKETVDSLNYIYNKIMPTFIRNILSFIYRYTFRYLFEFIGYITGYDNSVKKCYGFNVSTEVDNIKSNLNDIETAFTRDFGKLDFSKIKV